MATVCDSLVVAVPGLPGAGYAYSYTLASRAGELLNELELRYGRRDTSYTFLGVEFCQTGPQTWFPGNRKHVVIQLSLEAMTDETRALFQLAHECVHLLDPVVSGQATVFEEGVAALFALEQARQRCPTYSSANPKYDAAAAAAGSALEANPGVIRQLRDSGLPFGAFSPGGLSLACPNLSITACETLCRDFDTWGGV